MYVLYGLPNIYVVVNEGEKTMISIKLRIYNRVTKLDYIILIELKKVLVEKKNPTRNSCYLTFKLLRDNNISA